MDSRAAGFLPAELSRVIVLLEILMLRLMRSQAALSGRVTVSDGMLVSGQNATSGASALVEEAQREVARLYAERGEEFLRYALAFSRDEELVKDALQEAFMRYFIALCRGENIASPRAWVYRVLHNYLLDRFKENRRERASQHSDAPLWTQNQDLENECFRRELMGLIRGGLTAREYDCIRLRAEGLAYEEIAATLHLTSGSVGALISRAVRKIRRFISPTQR